MKKIENKEVFGYGFFIHHPRLGAIPQVFNKEESADRSYKNLGELYNNTEQDGRRILSEVEPFANQNDLYEKQNKLNQK